MRTFEWVWPVLVVACNSDATPPPPPRPETPAPALQADPVGEKDEPTHGDAALPFTITKVVTGQERRLSPPFHADKIDREMGWTYVEATLGGGTFGWLVPDKDAFDRIELVPTTSADGGRVVETFANAFKVYLPKPTSGGRLGRSEIPVVLVSRATSWLTTTWRCEDAEVFVQFNLSELRGRFVQKNRKGSWSWAGCLASALRDGSAP